LRDVGLPDDAQFLRRFPHQLSGGQQQRVMLALAFVLRPALIVLDEPTTALDVTTQAHILATLRRLCKSQGIAAVYVSHDLAVIKDLVDRVMVMYAGRIVEVAQREMLFHQPAHPYTRGLLAAIPDVAQRRDLPAIAGHAPAPGQRPQGCAFAPRCPRRLAACSVLEPQLQALSSQQRVACLAPHLQPLQRVAQACVAPVTDSVERTPLLQIKDLNVAYDRQVLFDVSLQVSAGECLALVGESGSGKTSLARAVAGLGENAEGELFYAGGLLSLSARQRDGAQRHQIQYIFQNPYRALNPRQSVFQTLSAPLEHFFGIKGAAARERVEAVLKRVSLPASVADLYPHSLSGGERQRVAIARALVCEPRLLICDEITSALDVSVQASILALLRQLQGEGLTLLFVTHDLGVVRAIADRVLVLKSGRVVEQGRVDQVLDQPQAAYTRTLLENSPTLAGGVL
jgi:peptide/nickel transport system ATP-binding protein